MSQFSSPCQLPFSPVSSAAAVPKMSLDNPSPSPVPTAAPPPSDGLKGEDITRAASTIGTAAEVQEVPLSVQPYPELPPPPQPPRPPSPSRSLHDPVRESDEQGVPDAAAEMKQECPPIPQMPQASLTFLLVSGRRRTMAFEPDTTVGRVKELVWNAWPSEWQDEQPPAPSYLRILHLGKILQDDDTLSKLKFPTYIPPTSCPASNSPPATPPSTPTIVHLAVRAYPPPVDEGKKKSRKRKSRRASHDEAEEEEADDGVHGGTTRAGASGGCGCVIC